MEQVLGQNRSSSAYSDDLCSSDGSYRESPSVTFETFFREDGVFVPFRPKAPEEYSEVFRLETPLKRAPALQVPQIRRFMSAVKGRAAVQKKVSVRHCSEKEEQDDGAVFAHCKSCRSQTPSETTSPGGPTSLSGTTTTNGMKHEVDTDVEDAEMSDVDPDDDGRPSFCALNCEDFDGCNMYTVKSKGQLRLQDEPPDFLQLPEPIKQRTAGAARVAAAARAWAAATSLLPQGPAGIAMLQQMQNAHQEALPPTARGPAPLSSSAAAIAAALAGSGANRANGMGESNYAVNSSNPAGYHSSHAVAEQRDAVAGPAVLALRRMRTRMSALAEGRLPWTFGRTGPERTSQQQQAQSAQAPLQPTPPSQPQGQQRRPMIPSIGRPRSGAVSSAAASGNNFAEGDQAPMSLVPQPPSQPKPPGNEDRSSGGFWRRLQRVNPFGGSSSSGGASSSNGQMTSNVDAAGPSAAVQPSSPRRPLGQATPTAGLRADYTPSSAAGFIDPGSPHRQA